MYAISVKFSVESASITSVAMTNYEQLSYIQGYCNIRRMQFNLVFVYIYGASRTERKFILIWQPKRKSICN